MQENYANCNIQYKNIDQIMSFTMGFKFLPRINDLFQYNSLTFEVVNVQHHQVMANGHEISTGSDATLYVKILDLERDVFKSNNS